MSERSTSSQAHIHLLPEAIRRRLDALMLNAASIRAGSMKGERRSVKRGTSIEFADYRNYTPGDDLRKLDWNVYARLEKPYIKLLEDEEDLAVHLLIDVSASMDYPQGDDDTSTHDHNKLLFAKRLTAALAYLSLSTGDRLLLSPLSETARPLFGPARGRGQSIALLRYLHDLTDDGMTDLNQRLRDFAIRERRAGLVIVLSDFFAPTGYSDGLNRLLGKGHEVVFIHILSPHDVNPPMAGDLRLIDSETGSVQEVTLDADMRARYQQRLTAWVDAMRDDCARRGVHYLMIESDTPYEKVIFYELRRLGIVR